MIMKEQTELEMSTRYDDVPLLLQCMLSLQLFKCISFIIRIYKLFWYNFYIYVTYSFLYFALKLVENNAISKQYNKLYCTIDIF